MFPIFSQLQGKPDQLFLTQQKQGVRKPFQFYSPSNVFLQGQGGLADTVDRSIDLMSRIEIHLAEHGTFHDKIIKYLLSQHYIIPGYRWQPLANQKPSLRISTNERPALARFWLRLLSMRILNFRAEGGLRLKCNYPRDMTLLSLDLKYWSCARSDK